MKILFSSFNSLQRYLRVLIFFIVSLLLIVLSGCSATTPPQTQVSGGEPSTLPQTQASGGEPSTPPQTQASGGEPSTPSTTTAPTVEVDLLYFHRPQRCTKCLCFERRVSDVVSEYFQAQIDSGQLTFQILNLGDKENVALVQKYGAVGSQLFLNTIINDKEHIKDIQEIWSWDCTSKTDRFNREVKNAIEMSLNGEI